MGSLMMLGILMMFALFFSCGIYMIAADCLSLPTYKAAIVVLNVLRQERKKNRNFEVYILILSSKLSNYIHLNEYKKRKLSSVLKSAEIKLSPETYIAKAWVKSGLVLLCIIPAIAVFPLISFLILFLSIMIYFKEIRSADEMMKKRKESIENELPRFALTLEQELKGNRDVLRILETYKNNAGVYFRDELEKTCADMRSGSFETALSRLECRIGSAMLSDVVRGLLSVLRGDDGQVYFQMLAHDFKLLEMQKLKLIARKRPGKVRKYSFIMLGCFVLTYLTVMGIQIMKAFGGMF
jgi:hypothetical protein